MIFYRIRFSALGLHVKPCLEKLSQDADHDVQHFANEALESKFSDKCEVQNKLSSFGFFEDIRNGRHSHR